MKSRLQKHVLFALHHVSFKYPKQKEYVFEDISIAIRFGESVAILSPEGHGRSSLLKLFLALEKPASGSVFINEFPASKIPESILQDYRAQVGFVFSNGGLLSNLSLRENIALPLRYHGALNPEEVSRRVEKILESFQLTEYAEQRPAFVSEYTRKMAAVARAIAMSPPALFLDNVFSALNRQQVIDLAIKLKESLTLAEGTLVATSNDPEQASHFAKRAIFIHKGRILFDGTFPELFSSTRIEIRKYLAETTLRAA